MSATSNTPAVSDRERALEAAILDIDAHATPLGEDDDGFVSVGAVAAWLDAHGVARSEWWWEDESNGTWHPGTTDSARLWDDGPRETWRATQ
jgi:hypothetical protein